MWTDTASIATTVPPHVLWRLFEDIASWTNWSARGAPAGPLAGPPLDGPAASSLRDRTASDHTRFRVSHALEPLPCGGTRIAYTIDMDGPDAQALGPQVTADLAAMLAALKALSGP